MFEPIVLYDKKFIPFIGENEIYTAIKRLVREMVSEFEYEQEVVFVVVLNGAFMFAADLLKEIINPCRITFIKVHSYAGSNSTGVVKELIGLNESLENKRVVLIEDIVDTGQTIDSLVAQLTARKPASLKVACLLFKPDAFKGNKKPDWIGFSIPDKFVVGYGLDYNGLGRNIPILYTSVEAEV